MMQPKQDNTLVWILIAGGAFFWYQSQQPKPSPNPDPGTGVPSAAMQSIVAPIKARAATNPSAAKVFGEHWRAMASVYPSSTCCATTGDFAELVKRWQTIMSANATLTPLPGLSADLDAATKAAFGDDVTALDKAKATEFCNAVAWALGG